MNNATPTKVITDFEEHITIRDAYHVTHSKAEKLYLSMEFALLYVGLPLVLWVINSRSLMFGTLWVGTAVTTFWLWKHRPETLRSLIHWRSRFVEMLKPVLLRFVLMAVAMTVFTYFINPDQLFMFPQEHTDKWLTIMLLYPLISVVPQEIFFRGFFYARYRMLFHWKWQRALISALIFGLAHIAFANPIAIGFSFIGGLLFSYSYRQHRSLLLACIEHSLYGMFLFTVGLGMYFYSGAVME